MRQRRGVAARVAAFALIGAMTITVLSAGAETFAASDTTTAKIKSAGISLAYPDSWTQVPLTAKALRSATKSMQKTNPKLASALADASAAVKENPPKLFAMDLDVSAAGSFGDNVNVVVVGGTLPKDVDEFTDSISGYYQQLGAVLEDSSAPKVAGKTAFRSDATYTLKDASGAPVPVRLAQLLVGTGGSSVVITVTTSDDADGIQKIDSLLSSVKYL